jgi:hypothetical protein
MSEEIACKFAGNTGRPRSCGGAAASFTRSAKSGRLCPLCEECLKSFEEAQKRIVAGSPAASQLGYDPKDMAYEVVGLEEGRAEWAAQPPKP